MSDTTYLNWARGNRLSLHTGLKAITPGMSYSNDYITLTVPARDCESLGKPLDEDTPQLVKSNTRVVLRPDVEIAAKKYRVAVDVNPLLFQYGDVSWQHVIDIGSGDQPHVYVTFRRQFDLTNLDYLVRLYLIA